ncbi:MAG: metallophosphoesterase [Bacteroidota bacterium]
MNIYSFVQQLIGDHRKHTGFLLLFKLFSCFLQAQERPPYFDGPYIFETVDSLKIKWIERGYPHDTTVVKTQADVFQRDSLPMVDLQKLAFPSQKASTYTGVERIVAISDVHGQYHIMHDLLRTSGAIDTTNNWALGQGHLVVIGDNFDRGDEVLPILWLLFKLEQQALAAGGRLHLLLGNHEQMVLEGDLRYLHKKYVYAAGVMRTPYHQLFVPGSVLGDWIAQHQVAVSINGNLFVHAGLSPEVLKLDLSLDEINTRFREQIIRQPFDSIADDPTLNLLSGEAGPLWYRGYFGEDALAKGKFKKQLKAYQLEKIIVGHTSHKSIHPRYEDQLIVIDCSIKLGRSGQVLLIENGEYYIIDQDGEKLPVAVITPTPTTSLQETLMASATRPKLILNTDFQHLIRYKMEEEYQPAEIALQIANTAYTFQGRVRTRGNVRKEVCNLPPLMIDLRKSELDSLGLLRHDKLKLVIPCSGRSVQQTNLYKEFLVYELYRIINDHGVETRLVDIEINSPNKQYLLTGFLIDTEKDYAHRTNADVIESGRINASSLDKACFARMQLFQYMIANCDWSLSNKHNLELVKYPEKARAEVVAYDFDYAGFVGNSYAVPADVLPIKSVHQRYFFDYGTEEAEIDQAIAYFQEKEVALIAACEAAHYLEEKERENCKDYLRSFFELLDKPDKFKRRIGI